MTTDERNRVYCCLIACEACGAQRGERCVSRKGKEWKNSHHAGRSPFGRGARWRKPELLKQYNKLIQQIENQKEVIGHE